MDLPASHPFSAHEFRRRAIAYDAARRNAGDQFDEYGDHRLNPSLRDAVLSEALRDAAVLVPVVDRGSEATVLLTKRTAGLRAHAGQVAFPGGRVDPEDISIEDAAMREAMEEVGLERRFIEVVGQLPRYNSGSGFRITPVMAVVQPGFTLTISPDEVDSAFEVPLGFLMNPANHTQDSRVWQGVERFFYRMPYQEWMIWGVTAGIIHAVYEGLYE